MFMTAAEGTMKGAMDSMTTAAVLFRDRSASDATDQTRGRTSSVAL